MARVAWLLLAVAVVAMGLSRRPKNPIGVGPWLRGSER